MNLYFAPLEGITGYIYRKAHMQMFGGCDAYYAPFITPVENEKLNKKYLKDILPQNNEGINLKVQVLVNNAAAFLNFEKEASEMGYKEININFGCPSSTVVKKDRGAGFLRNTEALSEFFDEVFSKNKADISVKTRIGFYDGSEMDAIMDVYNGYRLKSLIVHPRTRSDYYKGSVNMDVFEKVYNTSKNKLCYNGDVKNVKDFTYIKEKFPDLEGVMIGRGSVINPAVFREIRGGKRISTQELLDFSNLLYESYYKVLKSDTYTLHKLKEVWLYMIENYPDENKIRKGIKKANTVKELHFAVKDLPLIAE